MYPLGIVVLTLSATCVLTLWQMRRTVAIVAARRLGLVGGAMAGLGVGAIALGALAGRVDDVRPWAGLFAAAAILLAAAVLAKLGAQQATAFAQRHGSDRSSDTAMMELEPGQRAVWSTTLSSKWLLIPAVLVLLLGPILMLAPDTPVWLLGVTVLSGAACLSLASIRVTADAGGLDVKYGVLPWPSTSIAVDRIESASVIDVRPMEWGGWGYRGTLTLMRQAAVVLRAGPGIRVDLIDGRVFVVTVDDPEVGAALLNAEVARR